MHTHTHPHTPTHTHPHTHSGPATCTLVYVYRLKSHIVDIEVDGPGATTESRFTVCVRRDNPAQMGVVTGQATYASFYSSLTGMVECILTCTHKFSTCTITSCTIARGNASFYSSLTGMVECILTCTHKFSTCTITSCTIARGNNHSTHNTHSQHTVLQAHFNMHTRKRTCHTQTVLCIRTGGVSLSPRCPW